MRKTVTASCRHCRGNRLPNRPPLFFNDHKEAKQDHAASAIRIDSPQVVGTTIAGKWKLFFDARLLRAGTAKPVELFNLADDRAETTNRIDDPQLKPLIQHMTAQALLHRNLPGHRFAKLPHGKRAVFRWAKGGAPTALARQVAGRSTKGQTLKSAETGLEMHISAVEGTRVLADQQFTISNEGLGINGGFGAQVDANEAFLIRFNRDVIVESAAIVAGEGTCGGFYQLHKAAPLAIYCVDADIDANDQSGILSDLGVLKAGSVLAARFESSLWSRKRRPVESGGRQCSPIELTWAAIQAETEPSGSILSL